MASSINILKPSVCFEVQQIIGISTSDGRCKSYQVQWAPSWISGVHLVGCEDLIEQFEHNQKNKELDIKIEMVDDNATQDGHGVVFDDGVMQDANQPDDSPEEQLPDDHSNNSSHSNNSNVQVRENCFEMSHVNHPADENHNNDTNLKDLLTDSPFENNNQGKIKQLLQRNMQIDPNLQYLQQINVTSIHNDGSRKDEDVISLESDVLISDTINNTYCQDTSNISTMSVVTQTNKLAQSGCPKVPQPVRYFSDEVEPIIENKVAQINSNKLKKTLMCNYCHKTFRNYYNLKIHSKIHAATKDVYQCNICLEKCTSQINLQKHELIHAGERQRFPDSIKFKAQLCAHPARPRPCKCMICEKAFHNKSDLRRHLRVHTGERPFKCNVCQKRFKREHYVKKHMMTQHSQEKVFV